MLRGHIMTANALRCRETSVIDDGNSGPVGCDVAVITKRCRRYVVSTFASG